MNMNDALYMDLIAKYLSGNIETAEREQLMTWVESTPENRTFFAEMMQLWGISGHYEDHFPTDAETEWRKLENRLFGEEIATISPKSSSIEKTSAKIVRLSIKQVAFRVAAVILLAIAGSVWWFSDFGNNQNQTIAVATAAEERKMLELPDGSTIWLNENTNVSYEAAFDERIVQLEGEAFFNVAEMDGKPFTIFSGGATTTVLGTSFNVRAYPQETRVEVTVETGKVALRKAKDEAAKVLLTRGESGVFDKQAQTTAVIEQQISNADAWKNQQLDFSDTPMSEAILVLERYFSIDIEVKDQNILKCPVSGNYKNPSLQTIIDAWEFALTLEIEQQDSSRYLIQGAGCQ